VAAGIFDLPTTDDKPRHLPDIVLANWAGAARRGSHLFTHGAIARTSSQGDDQGFGIRLILGLKGKSGNGNAQELGEALPIRKQPSFGLAHSNAQDEIAMRAVRQPMVKKSRWTFIPVEIR